MQENEFEKRLQEEMGEFRLRPSDDVWSKIDVQLRKKKRRRVVFFIFLIAGLSLVGYSGYDLLTTKKQTLTEQKVTKTEKNFPENKKAHSTYDDAEKITPGDQASEKQKEAKDPGQILFPAENKTTASTGERIAAKKSRSNKRPVALQTVEPARKIEPGSTENIKPADDNLIDQQIDRSNKPVVAPSSVPSPESAAKNVKADEELTSEKVRSSTAKPDSAVAVTKKQEQKLPADQQKQKKKTISSIRWGLDLSVGVSQISNKAFSFSGVSQSADALYTNVPGNSTGGNTGGNLSSSRGPSDVLRGIAFKAGIVGEMNLSKRSSVSAGLGYAYYSNNIKTGSPKDSSFVLRTMTAQSVALNSYYQGSQVMEYTNHYHFVQLPIYYQLQLNKGVKAPLIWSIGVAPAYLFSTNALIYDTARGGIYYKNNDAFNKFHLNLNTGLSFRFGKPDKMQWSLGPELSMDMTGLVKDADDKRYFMYGGITGRVYFKKKNIK